MFKHPYATGKIMFIYLMMYINIDDIDYVN